ncbi:MAG TPA: LLM class flavin-dependent oxidoreductase [Hyphomicrobiaceae bacterium]|nr:LLM class flavin-dependent oxidoreductase [Hyphomicrobiaceae bacterium]
MWSAEHHFDGYTMCPNVMQFLTYMAGRTKHARLGSMVTVLPWHEPVRIAEEVSVLDHLSGGRVILGIGRGLGRTEFDGFRIPMGESRERFVAYSEAILGALETGVIKSDVPAYRQPPTSIRPTPWKSFKGRVYAAAVSPESAKIMARLGVGLLVIAQKPWDKTIAELEAYRALYREMNGTEAPRPIVVSWVACHEDASEAQRMYERYIRRYSRSATDHYEFYNPGLADIKGYEYYGALAKNIEKQGLDKFVEFLASLQIWATPDAVHDRIAEYCRLLDAESFVGVFGYGGMPADIAERNLRLFARTVLPRLKARRVGADRAA